MPLPLPPLPVPGRPTQPNRPGDPRAQPFVVRDHEDWVVTNEQRNITDVLYRYGEYAMFILLWNLGDYEAGLVDRCHRCFQAYNKIAQAYGQSSQAGCPECLGTTFEGGYRAKVVRPTIWTDAADDEDTQRRGTELKSNTVIQTTPDILLHDNDWVVRSNATRWEINSPTTTPIRTGFGRSPRERMISNQTVSVSPLMAKDNDTAYLVPPLTDADVMAVLDVSGPPPVDFSAIEDIRGYLLAR